MKEVETITVRLSKSQEKEAEKIVRMGFRSISEVMALAITAYVTNKTKNKTIKKNDRTN